MFSFSDSLILSLAMARSSPSNDEILCNIRYDEELYHRRCREYFFRDSPLTLNLNPSSLIPQIQHEQVQLEQIQDSCNKSTAMYFITPHFEPYTANYARDHGDRSDIIYFTYE